MNGSLHTQENSITQHLLPFVQQHSEYPKVIIIEEAD